MDNPLTALTAVSDLLNVRDFTLLLQQWKNRLPLRKSIPRVVYLRQDQGRGSVVWQRVIGAGGQNWRENPPQPVDIVEIAEGTLYGYDCGGDNPGLGFYFRQTVEDREEELTLLSLKKGRWGIYYLTEGSASTSTGSASFWEMLSHLDWQPVTVPKEAQRDGFRGGGLRMKRFGIFTSTWREQLKATETA